MGARRGTAVHLGALFGAVLLAGCGSGGAAPAAPLPEAGLITPAELPGDWPVARPQEMGIEARGLAVLVGRLRRGELGQVHGLLIVRHGRLAVEEYFAGSSRDDVHTQQSVTKSVTSLLVGIAIDEGLIRSEGERVLGFFRRAAGPIAWPRPVYYGQLFWLFPLGAGAEGASAGPDIVTASGAGGQWIFTAPSLDLVVVFTADRLNPGFFTPVDLLYGDILPAVG